MKCKKYFKLTVYLLSFVLVMTGCNKDSDDPPPVVNQPPDCTGLTDITLSPGFETHEIDFANYCMDQEGEIITYQVTNSNDDVITISLEGSVLTITEIDVGSSDVGVIATDGHDGHEVSYSFTVTIAPITGAADYNGTVQFMFDFNGLEGSLLDEGSPIPDWIWEGFKTDGEWSGSDVGSVTIENDHLVINNNVDTTFIWSETYFDSNQDYTGKKFRFDYCFFISPTLTGTHWFEPDEIPDQTAIDLRLYFVDETWEESGGQYLFSDMGLTYSAEWQAVEIPLSEFESLWGYPVDPSTVGVIGLEIWGGTDSAPISIRIDNFGIVD